MLQLIARLVLGLFFCISVQFSAVAQSITTQLSAAYKAFQGDAQLRNALTSLYVVDTETGKSVFEHNSLVGLVPASTLKVITSISAYELLGKEFKYKTKFAYQEKEGGSYIIILPEGDPTFGSWRWSGTKEEVVLNRLTQAIKQTGIKSISAVSINNFGWDTETIPDGWIWQDIGNYYGAGAAKLNWRENQFDVVLKSGTHLGDPVSIVSIKPDIKEYQLKSEVTSAAAGTGDKAYIYFPLTGTTGTIRGTIPVNKTSFTISGAMPDAAEQFVGTLLNRVAKAGIRSSGKVFETSANVPANSYRVFHTIESPPLDNIVYWFNKKSVNLYGEALVKTIAFQENKAGSTDTGTSIIKNFWRQKGIPDTELNIVDGSGLSPLNRVTTHAQVRILQYAQKQPWFNGFYDSLPQYNGIKMKSGTTGGVKGFCGYHQAANGKAYIFSFIVNNYNGSTTALVQKMYKVLDELK